MKQTVFLEFVDGNGGSEYNDCAGGPYKISDMKFLSSLSSYSSSESNRVSNKFRDDGYKHAVKIN